MLDTFHADAKKINTYRRSKEFKTQTAPDDIVKGKDSLIRLQYNTANIKGKQYRAKERHNSKAYNISECTIKLYPFFDKDIVQEINHKGRVPRATDLDQAKLWMLQALQSACSNYMPGTSSAQRVTGWSKMTEAVLSYAVYYQQDEQVQCIRKYANVKWFLKQVIHYLQKGFNMSNWSPEWLGFAEGGRFFSMM